MFVCLKHFYDWCKTARFILKPTQSHRNSRLCLIFKEVVRHPGPAFNVNTPIMRMVHTLVDTGLPSASSSSGSKGQPHLLANLHVYYNRLEYHTYQVRTPEEDS